MVVADIIRLRDEYEIVGFLDDVNTDPRGQEVLRSHGLGGQEQLDKLLHSGVGKITFALGIARTAKTLPPSTSERL
jgi:hypothetical protein